MFWTGTANDDVRQSASRSARALRELGAGMALAVLVVAGCSEDPGGDGDTGDTGGADVADATDAVDTTEPDDGGETDTGEPTDGGDTDADAGDGFLCESCTENTDCGGAEDQCLTMGDGENRCTRACDLETEAACPDGYQCSPVEEDSSTGQCVPENLTCADRCSDKSCGEGERCDPITGQCREPFGLCETGCTVSSMCGDGPDDICLSVRGAPDGERMCATGCDPEAENPDCPVDYSCSPLDPEGDPNRGVCFPIKGTCKERCADKDCPDGQNCNRLTGQCEEAQYGACEQGCENSGQCGGQQDLCLNLPLADGPHCWLDCSGPNGSCPSGYQCATLSGSTVALCVPESMRCDTCHGTDCFPGGACDPSSGMCTELDKDCTETGCAAEDEVCDPRSTDCVNIGRTCSGDSWARDCDNVVTTCTTHRSETTGSCERICSNDSECRSGEDCVETNIRDMCLGPDRGGSGACGTLHETSTQIGAPCSDDNNCSGGTSECVTNGNLDGFCSTSRSGPHR